MIFVCFESVAFTFMEICNELRYIGLEGVMLC